MERKMEASAAAPGNPATQKTDQRAGKYLTFRLGQEEFAVQVSRVREIMGVQEITAAPQTPGYVKGVISLRGKVIPVVDLRLRFGLPELGYTNRTCIIVTQLDAPETGKLLIGFIVDAVSQVLVLQAADIENAPDSGNSVAAPYLVGRAKIKGKVKSLLDIDMVLNAQDVQGLVSF
jgi:purine-binding chemotaxis protein CheW